MIFDLHGEPFVSRIERWTFGNGPGLQHSCHFKAEVIVQAGCFVLLDYKATAFFLLDLRRRFRRLFKTSLPFVFLEGHELDSDILTTGCGGGCTCT